MLLSPVTVRTLGNLRIVLGGVGSEFAMAAALVAKGWGNSFSIWVFSNRLIRGGGMLWLI